MKKIIGLLVLSVSLVSCVKENNGTTQKTDEFNRALILENWVNNLVLPAFTDFKSKIEDLKIKENRFVSNPTTTTQTELQEALFQAQKVWQHVAMFELQAEANGSNQNGTRIYMNTYPIDRETSTNPFPNSNEDDRTLEENLNGTPETINNLDFKNTSGTIDEQGFPALDYLINSENILQKYIDPTTAANYKTYMTKIVDRMVTLSNGAYNYWTNNADKIIANSGSSSSASFDKMVNDYINYVEQGFRENKISNASGKRDGIKNKFAVEAYYSSENSKIYFNEAFKAVQNFYKGISYDGTTNKEGLDDYLDYLDAEVYVSSKNEDVKLTDQVVKNFASIQNTVATLNDDFVVQTEQDPSKMITTFNVIQDYVVLIKTNALEAMGVTIDYADSDGD
ncbi:imelysin family protein [Ochrovirga pacifica]|uniref:imelysin family protein n=1 Tax=Ochrovirga pacifica TaxID=1042376 RepID=UPI0002557BBC|nr:imelysin family protein [Ochrovirga pacifica]